jgi:DNA polymerase III alpha subunit
MIHDQFGQMHVTENILCDMLYENPDLLLDKFLVDDPERYNESIRNTHSDLPTLKLYQALDIDLDEFDHKNQQSWSMPQEYAELDIAKHILELCKTTEDLQRVAQELLLFQEQNLFPLLCYLKYLVDTMRKNKVVWGVGRGSSVSSYILYLLGVHRINSLYYDLPIEEFLKEQK